MYSERVKDHFRNPRNMGKIKDPDGIGKVGNVICGDVMKLYIKVKNNKIVSIGWETFGCAAAIATTSMVSELAKSKDIKDALKISRKDVSNALESLPPIKEHCSNLAADALHEAVYDYFSKNKMKIPVELRKEHERIKHDIETIEHRHGH